MLHCVGTAHPPTINSTLHASDVSNKSPQRAPKSILRTRCRNRHRDMISLNSSVSLEVSVSVLSRNMSWGSRASPTPCPRSLRAMRPLSQSCQSYRCPGPIDLYVLPVCTACPSLLCTRRRLELLLLILRGLDTDQMVNNQVSTFLQFSHQL